jgi:hypothetical protein
MPQEVGEEEGCGEHGGRVGDWCTCSQIRKRRGVSLEVGAGLAGIKKQYLSMLELGQRGFNRRGLIGGLPTRSGGVVAQRAAAPAGVHVGNGAINVAGVDAAARAGGCDRHPRRVTATGADEGSPAGSAQITGDGTPTCCSLRIVRSNSCTAVSSSSLGPAAASRSSLVKIVFVGRVVRTLSLS